MTDETHGEGVVSVGNDDAFGKDLAAAGQLEVDVEHLGNISAYLTDLVHSIRNDLQPYIVRVNKLLTIGDSETKSTLGGTEIPEVGGGDDPNVGMAPRLNAMYHAVYDGLTGTADSMEKAAGAVQKIADKYGTTDARNAATAADFITTNG
jgi:hypothetical protein